MKIKYLINNDLRVQEFNKFISSKFPNLLTEENPDIYLVAGGDGAMLHSIHNTIDSNIPYIGKAMGTFNFLMNKFDDDEKAITDILEDRVNLEIFNSYAIEAYLDGKKLGEAANDVILGEKLTGYHTFKISTENGDFEDFEIKGSGLCISTAIGSTAFNFNNNGRILPLDSSLLSITGVVCNRYLNDIIEYQEIKIEANGARIYLTNVESEILSEGSVLTLKKGSKIGIAFFDKDDFLKRRRDIAHRYRK